MGITLNTNSVLSGMSTGIVPRFSLLTPPLWVVESVDNLNLQSGEVQSSTTVDPAGIFPDVNMIIFELPPGPVLSVELYADQRSSCNDGLSVFGPPPPFPVVSVEQPEIKHA